MTPGHFLRKLVYVPARKSTSNAVQLGGLPLSMSIIVGLFYFYTHDHFLSTFSELDHYGIKYWFLSAGIVMAYGYLDDKFELRPIVKLSLQILSIALFAVLESRVLFPKWGALAFVVSCFWGLGVLNGSNLLDGLDTLTIKLGTVTLLSYGVIALNFQIAPVIFGVGIGLSALASFYLFNKEPAKIHLGEIGGSFVGLFTLLLSSFIFTHMSQRGYAPLSSLSMALFPLSLPMSELGVSFLRRLYNKRSPFSGDKYHLHHILRNYYGLSPSRASSFFALGYAATMIISFSITHYFGPLIGIFSLVTLMVCSYIRVGYKHWQGDDHIDLNPASLFDYLLKKDVGVINSMAVDDFEIEIIHSHHEEDLEGHHDDDTGVDQSGKKAA